MPSAIQGVAVPDSKLAAEITELGRTAGRSDRSTIRERVADVWRPLSRVTLQHQTIAEEVLP